MGRKRTPGLRCRSGIWHIEKQVKGYGRLYESTGSSDLAEAERVLTHRLEEIRRSTIYGVRPRILFREAATKYLVDYAHKRSIERDARALEKLDPYVGDLDVSQVHVGCEGLQRFIAAGKAAGTINRELAVVRRILNLCARLWRHPNGQTWVETAPLIEMRPDAERRQPYPLSWPEQDLLFGKLAEHLREMALFKVNTGCREQEVAQLRWEWEQRMSELGTSVFVIPGWLAKNAQTRIVVLNRVARNVIERQRGKHDDRVFTEEGCPVTRIYNSGWKGARRRAAKVYEEEFGLECPDGFRKVRVHDLKHTFGRRLRSAGVSFEDRQDLLGHKSGRVTTHYSKAEIANLIDAAERACDRSSGKIPAVRLVRSNEVAATA